MSSSAPVQAPQLSPTPILDRLTPLPKMEGRGKRLLVSVVLGALIGAAGASLATFWRPPFVRSFSYEALAVVRNMFPQHFTVLNLVLFVVSLYAAQYLVVFIHEMAHAVVGVWMGFGFNSLRIGRLVFDRPFRISFYKGKGTGAGGWASLFPVKLDQLVLRATVMLLAGPVSNIVTATALVRVLHPTGMFASLFIYISFFIGIVNLIPLRSRAVISDGGRIWMLLWSRGRGERYLAMLRLLEEIRRGVAPEKLPPDFIAKAIAFEDKSPDTVTAHAIAYGTAFRQHKDEEAARLLETCFRHCALAAPTTRYALMSDAAVFQARRRRRVDLAQQWMGDIPQKLEYPWMRQRGEAAILEANGDLPGALAKLDEVEKIIAAVPNQAVREISLRNLRLWKDDLASPTMGKPDSEVSQSANSASAPLLQ